MKQDDAAINQYIEQHGFGLAKLPLTSFLSYG